MHTGQTGLSGLSGMGGQAPSSLLNGLAAYWKLEEASGTRFDVLGGSPLTSNNNVSQGTGKVGNCATFVAASSQYLSLGQALLTAGPFTLAVWVNRSSSAAVMGILSQTTAGGTTQALDVSAGGSARLTVNNSLYAVSASSSVGTGAWHLVVGTFDGSTAIVYLDGNNPGSPLLSTTFTAGAVATRLGSYNNATFFDGSLDEVGVWKRVLSGAEINALWNGGNGASWPFLGLGV